MSESDIGNLYNEDDKERSKFMGFLKKLLNAIMQPPQSQQVYTYEWNFENPPDLPDCREIESAGHKDKRVAVYHLEYKINATFSVEDFSYEDDIKNVNSFLSALEKDGWVKEPEQAEIINLVYTIEDLKVFLRRHNLKISGRKNELIKRLLDNVPFSELSERYKNKLYRVTETALQQIRLKKENYEQAVIDATHYAACQDWDNVYNTYRAFDEKWGFLHASGYRHTIFATYNVPWSQITFLCSYPMKELNNSKQFKNDLRYFLAASRLRKPKDRDKLTKEFRLINNEPINCPNIVDLYQSRDDLTEVSSTKHTIIKNGMQEKIDNYPDEALSYYISLLIYYCK